MDLNYLQYLEHEYKEDHEDRIENVSELCNVLLGIETEGKTFSAFMEDSLLASDQDRISQEESVKIMTVHAAKGLEWPVVFLPALEEGIFPSERSIMHWGCAGRRTAALLCGLHEGKRRTLPFVR